MKRSMSLQELEDALGRLFRTPDGTPTLEPGDEVLLNGRKMKIVQVFEAHGGRVILED